MLKNKIALHILAALVIFLLMYIFHIQNNCNGLQGKGCFFIKGTFLFWLLFLSIDTLSEFRNRVHIIGKYTLIRAIVIIPIFLLALIIWRAPIPFNREISTVILLSCGVGMRYIAGSAISSVKENEDTCR